jgi:plastocyanin
VSQQNFEDPRVPGPAEFFFDPVGLHVDPGAALEFEVLAGHHAISSYNLDNDRQRRIPADAPSFSSPMLGGYGNSEGPPKPGGDSQSWFYEFETEGVYDIYCPPHEVFGMVMRIVVGDVTETDFGPAAPQFLGPLEFAKNIFAQSDLEPATIRAEGPIHWDDLFPLEGNTDE